MGQTLCPRHGAASLERVDASSPPPGDAGRIPASLGKRQESGPSWTGGATEAGTVVGLIRSQCESKLEPIRERRGGLCEWNQRGLDVQASGTGAEQVNGSEGAGQAGRPLPILVPPARSLGGSLICFWEGLPLTSLLAGTVPAVTVRVDPPEPKPAPLRKLFSLSCDGLRSHPPRTDFAL